MAVNVKAILFLILSNSMSGGPVNAGFQLPDDIYDWCPFTSFCEQEPPKRVDQSANGVTPCCESCSCKEDCGLHRNCCSDEFDQYRIDETFKPVCKQLTEAEDHGQLYYKIVDKCPGLVDNCKNKTVSIWGSYHPVYSPKSNVIFHNKECAKCHNQTDVISLKVAIQCGAIDTPYSTSISSIMFGHVDGTTCSLKFIPPSHVDVYSHLCHIDEVRDCSPESSYYAQFTELCHRFNATYRRNFWRYANIYCYICNFKGMDMEAIQSKLVRGAMCETTVTNKLDDGSYTLLLTSTDIEKVAESTHEDDLMWCGNLDPGIEAQVNDVVEY